MHVANKKILQRINNDACVLIYLEIGTFDHDCAQLNAVIEVSSRGGNGAASRLTKPSLSTKH